MADRTFAIVGAGMAGAKAAVTLREEGFDGRVVLIGAEPEAPYERPPLSKGYLAGESGREEARVHPDGLYAEHRIEVEQGTAVTALDAAAHTLELRDGRVLSYDRVLIATGAVPRRPPIAGVELEGVHVLRTLADAEHHRVARDARAIGEPDALDTAVALDALDPRAGQQPYAVLMCRSAKKAPRSAPRTPSSGCSAYSMSVTSLPLPRTEAATSQPIQPAPTTTSRPPASSTARSASESSSVRST